MIEQEIPAISMTRSGGKKVLQLFQELSICSYWGAFDATYTVHEGRLYPKESALDWLGDWVTAFKNDEGLTYPDVLGIKIDHEYERDTLQKKLIRPTRDPRDATISNYERLKRQTYNHDRFDITCYNDMPLIATQGGIFGLSFIPEWFLQETMLHLLMPQEKLFSLYFEELEACNTKMVSDLVHFLSLQRSDEQIRIATENCAANRFGQKPVKEKWREDTYTLVRDHFDLYSGVLSCPHPYQASRSCSVQPIKRWDHESFEILMRLWIERKLQRGVNVFLHLDITPLLQPLVQIALTFETSPLIRFEFAALAMNHDSYRKNAMNELHELVENGSTYIKLLASSLLEIAGERAYEAKKREAYEALSPQASDRRHFEELLHESPGAVSP